MPQNTISAQDLINRTIIALDYPNAKAAEEFLKKLKHPELKAPNFMKVGLELFYADGPNVLTMLQARQMKVFLDLKLHDIPNTVYGAVRSLARYKPEILNVHASGGIEMMKAARQALLDAGAADTKLIAVTILTSLDQKKLNTELGIEIPLSELVVKLAQSAQEAGLNGVVCSPHEAALIKAACGKDFITVCPGVRPAGTSTDDQKRISTPLASLDNGADYIVMGRAVTQAQEPVGLFESFL